MGFLFCFYTIALRFYFTTIFTLTRFCVIGVFIHIVLLFACTHSAHAVYLVLFSICFSHLYCMHIQANFLLQPTFYGYIKLHLPYFVTKINIVSHFIYKCRVLKSFYYFCNRVCTNLKVCYSYKRCYKNIKKGERKNKNEPSTKTTCAKC